MTVLEEYDHGLQEEVKQDRAEGDTEEEDEEGGEYCSEVSIPTRLKPLGL
jgi:hypothetical protein